MTWLLGVAASDPVNLASVGLLMLLVALAGSYLPARSASRVNPVSVLRRD